MNRVLFLFLTYFTIITSCSTAEGQEADWSMNARFLVGMSMPLEKASSSRFSSTGAQAVSSYVSGTSTGGGWDADDMTWAFLFDATLHRHLVEGVNIGATVGIDRRGRVTGREFGDHFYTRLYTNYVKMGPQLSYIDRGSAIYLGLNFGLPLSMRLSNDTLSTSFETDSTVWNTLTEVQGGFRLYPFDFFTGQLVFNVDLGVALTPMYSFRNGKGFDDMLTLRGGFSYYWSLD